MKDIVRRLAKGFAFRHAPVLLLVAFLPFPTALIGASIANPMARALFAATADPSPSASRPPDSKLGQPVNLSGEPGPDLINPQAR
ncbi:hypothetical protein ACFYUV_31985 [Nonomuraea sp. NPDC003560]|uniref:hypothetical protein n=1 Tax=Nonomuraea sp. NPDC003560 TaxID=3364341 RepID=UPI00368A7305